MRVALIAGENEMNVYENWEDEQLMNLSMAFHKLEEEGIELGDAIDSIWNMITIEIESRKGITEQKVRHVDYDLSAAIGYNQGDAGFEVDDIAEVLAEVPGEADGPGWHWLLRLKGKLGFVYLVGWCDYTGWDWQSGVSSEFAGTLKGALKFAKDEDNDYQRQMVKTQLQKQLDGKQPYGVYVQP